MRVLLHSLIPVTPCAEGFRTDPLWARDINTLATQADVVLVCPVAAAGDGIALTAGIAVHDCFRADLADLVARADVVQLPGNFGWRSARLAFALKSLARKLDKRVIVGISSNRARTAWLNRRPGFAGSVRAALQYLDIRCTQTWLASGTSGLFVVGAGLRKLVRHPNVHVATASWIRAAEIARREERPPGTATRVCIASRLEPMKGVSLGVDAVLAAVHAGFPVEFDVVGEGPERARLLTRVATTGLQPRTRFLGQLGYPAAFYAYLQTADFVLLTNLNDEQPRLIFDAISQGCIPICPDSTAYAALELPRELLYRQGDAQALAAVLTRCLALSTLARMKLCGDLYRIAEANTVERMHERRLQWIAHV